MAGADYDYTKSLLPAGNGAIHAMSGGGYGQSQEGGAYLSQKKLDELFSFIYDEKDSKSYLTNNKTNDSKLIGIISNLLFRKLTASEPLFSTVKDNKTNSYLYYKIVKSDSGADNFIVTPSVTSGTKPDLSKQISGATQTGSGNISKDNNDKLLSRLFNILMNRDDPDSAKQVNEIRLLFSFKESSLPNKYVPILEDIKGAAKKVFRKIKDDEYNKIAAEFPMLFGGGGAPPADFETQAQALIDGIPKLGDKVTAIKPIADKYKVDNPGSDAEIDILVKAVDDSLKSYNGSISKIAAVRAKLSTSAGDAAKKVVIDDMTQMINGELKTFGDAFEKALVALQTKIFAGPTDASSVPPYGKQAKEIVDEIKALNTSALNKAMADLKTAVANLPTDGSQQALTDRALKLEERFTENTKDDMQGYVDDAEDTALDEDERKKAVADLAKRRDDLKKIPSDVDDLQKDIAAVLGISPPGPGPVVQPKVPVVKAKQTITVLNMPYTLMLPVEAEDFDNLNNPVFEQLKKLHHDFGLDYIRDGVQKANVKKAEFVNNIDKCQNVVKTLKDEDCTKFRSIVTEVIQNIVGMDNIPLVAGATGTTSGGSTGASAGSSNGATAAGITGATAGITGATAGGSTGATADGATAGGSTGATADGVTGATAGGSTGATAGGSTGATAGGSTGATADGVTGATAGGSTGATADGVTGATTNFETLAKSLESELTQIKKTYEELIEKIISKIKNITDETKKIEYIEKINIIIENYTAKYFTTEDKDPFDTFITRHVKAATAAQKETPPNAKEGMEAIKALNDLKTNLENANKEFNKSLSSAGEDEPGGSEKLGKGIKPKDAATCYFNGIIQMLNQIPEFVEAITNFDGTKFKTTQDATKELDFFTEKQISDKEEANKRAQAKIDAVKAANEAFGKDKTKTITYDTADRLEIKRLETSFNAIKDKIAEKYKSDIQGKSADEIKIIIKLYLDIKKDPTLYLDIKKDPTKATPENKEIADFYTEFTKLKTSIEIKEKEAGSKIPGAWQDTDGSIKPSKISDLEQDLRKKVGEVEGYKEKLQSGKKVSFDKFIEPLNALKSIYTKLNSTDTNTKIEIDNDILRLLDYKRGEYLEKVGGRLRQEDAKGLLTSVIFDLFQKEQKLKQIYNKLIFDTKDTIICDLDVDQKEVVVPQKLPDGSESETQINLILYTSIPDPPSDKQTIQTFINNYEVASNRTTDMCIDFPINTAKSINKIIIPKDNKYLFVNLGREYSTGVIQGIKENNITIEHEITIDDKKFIAVGVLIYNGNIGSGHYLFHTLKEGPDGNSISNVEYNDSNVFTINSTNPSAYNINTKGLLFLYKRKEPMVGGGRRLGLRGRSTLRSSRIAPEQSTGKRTLKARTSANENRKQTSFNDLTSTPSRAQTKRRHLKGRTAQSQTERSRVSGRLPIRRAAGK